MRIPLLPPSIESLFKSTSPQRLLEIISQSPNWMKKDRYLHWDGLRRRPAPAGFTNEEWWLGIKLGRNAQLRPILLQDRKGHPFRLGQPDSLTELLHHIDRGLGAALGIPQVIESPESRDRYVVRTLLEESITSSQLEGAATTRAVAKEMLQTGRPPRDKSERMILNNYLTMRRIRDLRDAPLTPQMVFELHERVTEHTLDNPQAAARFRQPSELIRVEDNIDGTVYHEPPPSDQLPARMEAMCAFANGDSPDFYVHPVIRAIVLHFWLAYDHPFVDGNGRTARALFYWAMLRQGYELFEFISISQVLLRAPIRYGEAFLQTETDDNDLTYFILHQAEVIREAVDSLREYVKRKTTELHAAEQCMRGFAGLNHRQQALLAHALREPATRYVIASHQHSHDVSHQTARNDLFDLVEHGLLSVRRVGRTYYFRAVADLAEKLGKQATSHPKQEDSDQTLPLKLPFSSKSD
jgi:Fic family protein